MRSTAKTLLAFNIEVALSDNTRITCSEPCATLALRVVRECGVVALSDKTQIRVKQTLRQLGATRAETAWTGCSDFANLTKFRRPPCSQVMQRVPVRRQFQQDAKAARPTRISACRAPYRVAQEESRELECVGKTTLFTPPTSQSYFSGSLSRGVVAFPQSGRAQWFWQTSISRRLAWLH